MCYVRDSVRSWTDEKVKYAGLIMLFLLLGGLLSAGAVDPAVVDLDGNLTIDVGDLLIFSPAWLSHGGPSDDWNGACDISNPPDGVIDSLDLDALTADWLVVIPDPNDFINPADINGDRAIDANDLLIFFAAWLSDDSPTVNWNAACDIADPPDGVINSADFSVLSSQWLLTVPDPNDYVGVPDLNDDRIVNLFDYSILASAWLADDNPMLNWNWRCNVAEPNDGCIDARDFAVLAKNWGFVIPDPNIFAFIPGGEFEMGDPLDAMYDAQPVHTVRLDSFYMSRFQMTFQRYCDFLNSAIASGDIKVDGYVVYAFDDDENSHSYFRTHQYESYSNSQIDYIDGVFSVRIKDGVTDMSNHPVVQVNWFGAAAYCNWKSTQEGRVSCYDLSTWQCDFTADGYRLATEAEWEYAARGGLTGKRYPWGDTIDGSMANYQDSGDPFETGDYSWTTPVGYYDGNQTPAGVDMANGYGLYDMAGNIYEWCYDWYDKNYYQACNDLGTVANPTGPVDGVSRILRGGSWNFNTKVCRIANRDSQHAPGNFSGSYGFRICIAAP